MTYNVPIILILTHILKSITICCRTVGLRRQRFIGLGDCVNMGSYENPVLQCLFRCFGH